MDAHTFRKMLEYRGYSHVTVRFTEASLEWTVEDERLIRVLTFSQTEFAAMTIASARDELDALLGEGMKHVLHQCGQVLLVANTQWVGAGPFAHLLTGCYAVPLHEDDEPIAVCPRCKQALYPDTTLLRIDDADMLKNQPLDEEFHDEFLPRDAECVDGDLAFYEGNFSAAEEHFRTALDLDDLRKTEAGLYLGLTLLWQKKLDEAFECFDVDLEERGFRVSAFFLLWCALCFFEQPSAFLQEVERQYGALGWLGGAEESTRNSGSAELHEPSVMSQHQEAVEVLKEFLAEDTIDDPETPGDRLFLALISYLRQDYRRVLALLYESTEQRFGWARAFWIGMACIELGRETDTQRFLTESMKPMDDASPTTRIPPVLLAPLHWSEPRHPAEFATIIQPLLANYG